MLSFYELDNINKYLHYHLQYLDPLSIFSSGWSVFPYKNKSY